MEFDPDLPLTRLQLRLLNVLRAFGPCDVTTLRPQFRVSAPAIRHALALLLQGGWVSRFQPRPEVPASYDVTAAGRAAVRGAVSRR